MSTQETPKPTFIPRLYCYFSCPFCVRVEYFLRLKKIQFELTYLDTHDEKAHIDKVGSKLVPILEYEPGKFMKESMDIVHYLDKTYGPALLQAVPSDRKEAHDALEDFEVSYHLMLPRVYDLSPALPELAKPESRDYFKQKKEKQMMVSFDKAKEKAPEYLKRLQAALDKLAPFIASDKGVHGDFVTADDVALVAKLFLTTLFAPSEITRPKQAYLDYQVKQTGLPLFHDYAGRTTNSVISSALVEEKKAFTVRLYEYFHCPYCVRVEYFLRLKKIKFEIVYLDHHDEKAHIDKVGSKQVPILEYEPGKYLKESMDIVHYLDKTYGRALLQEIPSDRKEAHEQIEDFELSYHLYLPRLVAIKPPLPEFTKPEALEYFTKKKQNQMMMTFEKAKEKVPEYLKRLQAALDKLAPVIASDKGVHGDFVTTDDVALVAKLFELTVLAPGEVTVPKKVQSYLDYHVKHTGLPTFATRLSSA